MNNYIKILQGKYNYTSQNKIYSEENFKIFKEEDRKLNYVFKSEILSRVKTGEFLKIYVTYRVNQHFDPINVEIERLMGQKESFEKFQIDPKTKNYHYILKGIDSTETYDKIISSRPHIATPSFLTSMLMTNQKRLDPVQRTTYTIVTSNNVWNFEEPFREKTIIAELQSLEPKDIIVNKKSLKATHCKLLHENQGTSTASGHDIYLSKHFNIPYLGVFSDDLRIEIDHLRSFQADLPQI